MSKIATYDLGKAVVRIEIDRGDLRSGLAAARTETAAGVAAMQRDINAGTKGMSHSFSQFASDVRNAMARTTADVNAASAASVRKLQEISRAANHTVGSLNALAASADNMAGRMSRDWSAAAVAANRSADSQVDSIHRIETALAELKAEQAMMGDSRRVFTGGPAGGGGATQFVSTGGASTVRLDGAQYAGLISAIMAGGAGGGGGGGGTTIVPAASGGGGGSSGNSGALLSTLLLGRSGAGVHRIGGRFGFPIFGAGLGSVGSFAGLGMEHVLTTLLGLGGSAAGGVVGAGLLGGGALAKVAVGSGADIAAMKTATTNIQNTTQAIDAYNTAVATFGKNSTQAQHALQQMNFAIKDMPKQLQAQNLAVAKANLALGDYWKSSSAGAVHQAYTLIQAGQQIVHEYIPLVGEAAAKNLAIINTGLKPLFAWIKGPDGLAIFNDLEQQFAHQLPTAVHAFDQAAEFMLRLLDQASHHTGGLTQWLDKLFTRLNNLSNPQIDYGIMKFVRFFREWKDLIKALGTDIVLLFRNEAGTASSILQTLTHMLNKVGDWERTISARQQIHTIFQVHKEQVLAIMHAFGLLLPVFAKLYLTLGPPFTRLFTTLANGLSSVLGALEKIPGGTWVLGLTLLSGKLLGISKTLGIIGKGLGGMLGLLSKLAGEGGAAKVLGSLGSLLSGGGLKTAAAGGAVKEGEQLALDVGGGASGATGAGLLARVGMGGLPELLASPPVAAALAVGGAAALVASLIPHTTPTAQQATARAVEAQASHGITGQVTRYGLPDTPAVRAMIAHPNAQQGPTKDDVQRLKDWLHTAEDSQKVGHANAEQLARWHAEGERLAKLFPGMRDEINKDNKAIDAQRAAVSRVQNLMSMHWTDAGIKSIKNLKDAFTTNMGLIASSIGLHTAEGRDLMKKNVDQMISHTLEGMKKGKIGVQQGMAAIEHAISVGMKNGALNADQATTRMVNTLHTLYNKGKINATQFSKDLVSVFQTYSRKGADIWGKGTNDILHTLANLRAKGKITLQALMDDVNSIWKSGITHLNQQTDGWYQTQRSIYIKERKDHVLTQKELNSDLASLEMVRNERSKGNIEAWAQNILNGMVQSGKISLSGAQAIAKQLNELLVGLHASKIPVPTSVAVAAYQASHGLASSPGHRGQSGAIWQVGSRGQRGPDSVPMTIGDQPYMVAPGEQVVVLTQHHQRELNSLFAPMGGLPGYFANRRRPHNMATGGYVFPFTSSFNMGRTDMGIDGGMAVGAPIGPIGRARMGQQYPNWYAGQPLMHWQLLDGPMAGKWVYLAEQIQPAAAPGQVVAANQAVAHFKSSGTGIEMGWGTSGEATLAQQTSGYSEGQQTPAGLDFRAFLLGLAHGKIVGGNIGMATINAPQAKGPAGPYKTAVQRSFDMGTAAANALYQKKLAASGFLGGSFSGVSFASKGPVEARIAADAKKVGVNKIGIAGIIGNAYRESLLNPASVGSGGGGLFGFTPLGPEQAFAQSRGKPWTDVDAQMEFMFQQWFQQDSGAVSAINSQKSPSAAADYFMNTYERPSIKAQAEREQAAQAAYAQGYQRGGIVGHPGRLHRHHGHHENINDLRRKYPHAWAFIRHLSPGFPPQDLGERWLHNLEHTTAWAPAKQSYLSKKYLDTFLKRLSDISSHQIPRLQEQASSISDIMGAGGHTPHSLRKIRGLDRHAAMLAIQGAHTIKRLQAAVDIANKNNKKKPPFTAEAKRLRGFANNFMGISGHGGLVHDTELALMQELQGDGTQPGRHSQHMMELLRQQNQMLREKLAVERAQYRALTGRGAPAGVLPTDPPRHHFPHHHHPHHPHHHHPHHRGHHHHHHLTGGAGHLGHELTGSAGFLSFGGMMHRGGIIPGPPGMPVNVLAEAGERIIERGGDQMPIKVVIEPRGGTDRLINAHVERNGRRIARTVGYGLPSRGGY